MSDPDPPPLRPTLTTWRIQREVQHRLKRSPAAPDVAGRLPARIEAFETGVIDPPVELAQVDGEPDHMMCVKGGREPGELERPHGLDQLLDEATPQFTLRNTWRLERFADTEWLEYEGLEVGRIGHWEDLDAARECHADTALATLRTQQLASAGMRAHVALRRALVLESRWIDHFGRPEPVAVEPESSPEASGRAPEKR